MFSIAVTGGIASGKSLFGQILSGLGMDVADADEIVRAMHQPHGKGAQIIADSFGSEFLSSDGGTDRKRLGSLVFQDVQARNRLDSLIHPIVRDELSAWKNKPSASPFKAALIPLLFEKGWEKDWDLTVCMIAPEKLRFDRICARGIEPEEAQNRMMAQMTSAEKAARADIVIHNDATVSDLYKAAVRLVSHIMEKIQK